MIALLRHFDLYDYCKGEHCSPLQYFKLGDNMKNNWDVKNYTDNFNFVHKYGEDVVDLITAPKGSFVVDLGCGNGALSEKIKEKGYNVIGIDASKQMLEKAALLHPDIEFMLGDACEFVLSKNADAIFSNAVFHWINDQEALIKNIAYNLKIGGELVFEFGGKGCAQTVHFALAKSFEKYGKIYNNEFNFKSIGEFAPLLEKYGFRVEFATLFDRPTVQIGEDGLENWINMFCLSAFDNVDKQTKNNIIKDAVQMCKPNLYRNGKWYVDYVRLRMKAVKKV